MSVLQYKTPDGVWHEIVTIKGDKGATGLKGASVTGASIEDGILWLECVTYTEQGEVPFRIEVGNVKGDPGDTGAGVPTGGTAGQVLVKTGDGDFETEWGDQYKPGPGDKTDVRINGVSLVVDGVAEIPFGSETVFGVVKANYGKGTFIDGSGVIATVRSSQADINGRTNEFKGITPANLDYAVKAAMGDGKGAPWDAATKQNAQARMGLNTVDALPAEPVAGEIYFVRA